MTQGDFVVELTLRIPLAAEHPMSTRLATHTRYMPSNAQERLTLLSNAASSDEALGLLQSAETNLRLALCFVPGDKGVTEALARVVATRERLRRSSSI